MREAIPQVKIRREGTFGEVGGDEGLLRQALLNVGRNAAEACASAVDGGRVVIHGEIVRGNKTDFQTIVISDNGPGISAEALRKLFVPFFTTKAAGIGLGLAIVRRIVWEHGGDIACTSAEGQGTCFHIMLPVPDTSASRATPAEGSEYAHQGISSR